MEEVEIMEASSLQGLALVIAITGLLLITSKPAGAR
jgi:hypothetical protein